MKPNCSYCIHAGELKDYRYPCRNLGFEVVANRINKLISKREVCRAEELGKGVFKLDRKKYNEKEINHE